MAIWHSQLGVAPHESDYRPPRDGRMIVSWHLHPKATRATATPFQASDLTPWMPPIGNQDRIGACNSYGTKDGASTSLAAAGAGRGPYLAALPLYRLTRCVERAASNSFGELPPLTDSGASPDDVLAVAHRYGVMTSLEECGEPGPSDDLSAYEDNHVNDEPTVDELELDAGFKLVGGFDITATGQQRLHDVTDALAAGYAVGCAVYAEDMRFQGYSSGVMPDPPAGRRCDHWIYLVGAFADATGAPVFCLVNSWSTSWGQPWSAAPGGTALVGPGTIHAADCLIAYAVSGVSS